MASAGVRPRRRWQLRRLIALFLLFAPAAHGDTPVASTGATLAIPDVPYLPQSEALCGGAALAMVLRYWGTEGVRPEDFAGSLAPDGRGITTEALQRAAEARGARAYAVATAASEAAAHLAQGRPLIALISVGPGRHHYVVLLAWANGRVLFHDPAAAPFRVMPEREWVEAWSATGNWALLVLPGDTDAPRTEAPPPAVSEEESGACAALVGPAVTQAREGNVDSAKAQLEAAAAFCPDSSAPWRELASLEFRRENWSGAQGFAVKAVGVDARDTFAWRLLATSRFLGGQREEALAAWNEVGEPRIDLVTIDGLDRTPFRSISSYLGETAGSLLTPARLRRAQRRLSGLPAAQASRVGYRPLKDGRARLEVAIVERPAFTSPRTLLLQSVLRAASEHTIGADGLAVARTGDTLRVQGFWHSRRLRGMLAAAGPRALGLPGIVTAEALWDEQSYRLTENGPLVRERRRRGALSISDWWGADTRGRVTLAADEYERRGTHVSAGVDVDRRLLRDRLSLGGGATGFWLGTPFYAGSIRAAARSHTAPSVAVLRLGAAFDAASVHAPLALWAGAGTGPGRSPLLRAHPLLRDGIIDGAAFGRRLLSGTAEGDAPIASVGPIRLRAAVFVDWAAVLSPAPRRHFVDVGAGLRLRPPGWASTFRLDVATSTRDVSPRVSAGWQGEWPN